MMGTRVASAQLLYDFCPDDRVPDDHLLRRVDQFLDLDTVRSELKPFCSPIGRPSIDPVRTPPVRGCPPQPSLQMVCRLGLDGKVPSTRMPAISPGPWRIRRPMIVRGIGARRSRCSLPISSTSSDSADFGYADRRGQRRVPPRRHRAKPEEAGKASSDAVCRHRGSMTPGAPRDRPRRHKGHLVPGGRTAGPKSSFNGRYVDLASIESTISAPSGRTRV